MSGKETRRRALEQQVARLDRRLDALGRASNRASWARLGTFGGAVVAALLAGIVWGTWAGGIAALAGLVAFIAAARAHRRIRAGIARCTTWRAIKRAHLARMDRRWPDLPPATITTPRPDHPVERDLDLVGERSLHRLIDTCAAREASRRLRDWLATTVPDPVQIAHRQALVRELAGLPIFRDKLRLAAVQAAPGRVRRWESKRLMDWLDQVAPPAGLLGWLWPLAALATLNLVLLVLNGLGVIPPLWRVSLVLYAGLYLAQVLRLNDPFSMALALRDPLYDLRAVFTHLETYRYGRNAALRALCAPFLDRDRRPSDQLTRVTRALAAASVRGNPPLWMLLSLVVPWDLLVMRWLEQSRAGLAARLPDWLDTWFELEALGALATLAYLNPAYTFPVIAAADERPVFEGRALGHPLIPDATRVCNDFTLAQPGDLALITGSNMSGKSTFLRTLGINLCLAYAGGSVNAAALQTVPLRLFTCIRVTDSVMDGISYFYAEVKCLKRLLNGLEAEHPYPALYLIDEIFRGTNNRERLTGSRAYIRALVARGGVGALATHDLELVRLADELPPIKNYHFEEHIAEGRMMFDYRLRTGPCPTTNALKIMRMEGLPVDVPSGEQE